MCYTIPGKIVEINGNIAVIDYYGEKRRAFLDLDAKVGDYVYAQGGVVISKIAEEQAIEILNFWKDKFFELKEIDKKISKTKSHKARKNILEILQKANLGKELNKKEMLAILKIKDKNELNLLFETANNIRMKELKNSCCVHGIIEFSNYCKNNCFFCGIRKDNKIKRYRMGVEEIIKAAKDAVKLGFKAIVLQSGEDLWYDGKKLLKIVEEIRKLGVLIFLSIGERSIALYKKLFDAGAKAVLLRFETSKLLYKKLKPESDFDKRIKLIKELKKIGFITATGFLIGLGESYNDFIDNILLTKSLRPDMYSFGPLIPAKGTPMEKQKLIDKNLVLKTIALTRLVDRKAKILVTTALETLAKDAKKQGLLAGGNSLMIDVTPKKYKRLYVIYNKPIKEVKKEIDGTLKLLYSIGRAPTDLGV